MLLVAAYTFGQPAEKAVNQGSTSEPKTASNEGGKFNLPPEKRSPVVVPKITEEAITIDGRADEEAWKNAALFKDFYQVYPGDNTAASKPTEVRMLYDEKYLYISFKCWDDRDKIRATLAKRDEVFGEDNVRVWIDTFNDQRRAYVLGFNPLGVQQDGIYTEGSGADFSVDIVMESKGLIEDWGWSVEAKIPFKSLRYSAGDGKKWGFNVARNIDRLNDELDQWMPDDRNISGFLIKHGKITGLSEIKYEKTLEIVPSITVSETGSRRRTIPISTANANGYDPTYFPIGIQDPGRFVNAGIKADLGLNIKYNFTPNITLSAAINPDFAEIEADAPVVAANQRFPIFFQEKRPFFLEGKEIFDTPINAFYSRTIVDPDAAVKLTGKIGSNTFGFLVASDNAPGNYSDDERNDPVIGPRIAQYDGKNALFSVLRVKHDIGSENSIGFLATARIFPNNRNFVGGFDGRYKLDAKTVFRFQVLGSHSLKNFYDPFEDQSRYRTGNGIAYDFNLDNTGDLKGWTLDLSGKSKDYRADSGFTQRTDTHRVFWGSRLSTKSKPEKTLIRTDWRQGFNVAVDGKGRLQEVFGSSTFGFSLQKNLSVSVETGVGIEKLYEDEFGPARNTEIGRSGAFVGDSFRSAWQPYVSINLNKRINSKLFVYGFVGSIINAHDYDFGGGYRYPRASEPFQTYLQSPPYLNYLANLYLYQADPNNIPLPNLPEPPALDPGRGWQFDADVGFEYSPTDPLKFSLEYRKSRLRRNDTGLTAFDSNIFTVRSTYQFTRFTFARIRFDYDTLRSNAGGQALLGWAPNPGTAFYVGYNDNFNYDGFSPFTGQYEPGFERNSRTFFIRASYLFRKSF